MLLGQNVDKRPNHTGTHDSELKMLHSRRMRRISTSEMAWMPEVDRVWVSELRCSVGPSQVTSQKSQEERIHALDDTLDN